MTEFYTVGLCWGPRPGLLDAMLVFHQMFWISWTNCSRNQCWHLVSLLSFIASCSAHKASGENRLSVIKARRSQKKMTIVVFEFKKHLFNTFYVLYARRLLASAGLWCSILHISMLQCICQVSDSPLQSLWSGHHWPLALNGTGVTPPPPPDF